MHNKNRERITKIIAGFMAGLMILGCIASILI